MPIYQTVTHNSYYFYILLFPDKNETLCRRIVSLPKGSKLPQIAQRPKDEESLVTFCYEKRRKKILKKGAFPTLNLLPNERKRPSNSAREERLSKKSRKEIIDELCSEGTFYYFFYLYCKQYCISTIQGGRCYYKTITVLGKKPLHQVFGIMILYEIFIKDVLCLQFLQ